MIIETPDKMEARYRWRKFAVVGSIVSCLAGVADWRITIGSLLLVAALTYIQKSRKILITRDAVSYFLPLNSARTVQFSRVTSIKRVFMTQADLGSYTFTEGAQFEIENEPPVQIPLDLPERDVVFERIKAAWEQYRATSGAPKLQLHDQKLSL